jgi:hypothetical protein
MSFEAETGGQAERKIFSREGFPREAKAWLDAQGIAPEYGSNYRLRPESPGHRLFTEFLLTELEGLPFDGSQGAAIPMRSDAKEVVGRLAAFVRARLQEMDRGEAWNSAAVSEIADIFADGRLEVFKNEIYASHRMDGVGYNIDLSADHHDGRLTPAELILERRRVEAKEGLKVTDNGFFTLSLKTGTLAMDIEEFPTANVHTGP